MILYRFLNLWKISIMAFRTSSHSIRFWILLVFSMPCGMNWTFSCRSRLTISFWGLPPVNCAFGGRLGFLSIFSLFSRSGFWSSNRQGEISFFILIFLFFFPVWCVLLLVNYLPHIHYLNFDPVDNFRIHLGVHFAVWWMRFKSTTVLLRFFARLEPLLWRSFIFTGIFWTIRNLLIRDISCESSLWSRLVFLPHVSFLVQKRSFGFVWLWVR